ncbi:hypothetical protein FHX75_111418 [Micromonospora palomenae]|uniref:Uncharacterized protein n=1 Tax=Micromonospora palomenae TaxID=1461247 RepID=A0A561WWL8_9ACTN|nr:hypothetical protein FHX75_111418 [Micromonospora palomenae]
MPQPAGRSTLTAAGGDVLRLNPVLPDGLDQLNSA